LPAVLRGVQQNLVGAPGNLQGNLQPQ